MGMILNPNPPVRRKFKIEDIEEIHLMSSRVINDGWFYMPFIRIIQKEEGDDNMIHKNVLEEVRHELVVLNGLDAFDNLGDNVDKGRITTVVPNEDLIKLDYSNLIKKLDEFIEDYNKLNSILKKYEDEEFDRTQSRGGR